MNKMENLQPFSAKNDNAVKNKTKYKQIFPSLRPDLMIEDAARNTNIRAASTLTNYEKNHKTPLSLVSYQPRLPN